LNCQCFELEGVSANNPDMLLGLNQQTELGKRFILTMVKECYNEQETGDYTAG